MHNNNIPVRILLILPDGKIHKLKLPFIDISFREAPLTATMLAALTPAHIPAHITIADESVDRIPFNRPFDLVGISCLTGTSIRAYEIADQFRQSNITVILGGVHATLMPEEAAKHADAVVIGDGDLSWGQLLEDFSNNRLKPVYKSKDTLVDNLPIPRRDLQKRFGYAIPNTVSATQGCRKICDFCTVPALKKGWHTRPINQVLTDIKSIKAKRFVFNDVNLTEDTLYAKTLLRELIPLKKKWGGLATSAILDDEELLELFRESGCSYLLIGFESFNRKSLSSINKQFNHVTRYKELVERLHAMHIIVHGCFIFGFDDDDKHVFQNTVDMVNELKIDIPRYALYTPYPGTRAFNRLDAENRLLHKDWQFYDTQHVVFKPAAMSPQELDKGFKWAFRKTYSMGSSMRRTLRMDPNTPIAFLGNLAYKLYIRRLERETHRFPAECSPSVTTGNLGHEEGRAA